MSNLLDYLDDEDKLGNKYEQFLKLKAKLEKDGIPENIATYQASRILTPEKLEKIHLLAKKKDGQRNAVVLFFNSQTDLDLFIKYFPISVGNGNENQCAHPELLIELLKLLEQYEKDK